MTSFSFQLRTIRRLKVPEGISRRYDCPFCGHSNTLGVSNINGVLEWNCFSASCIAKGILDEGSTVNGLQQRLSTKQSEVDRMGKPIPVFLTSVTQSEHLEYLQSVNSLEAYKQKLVDVVYAPAENRILFPVASGKGYTGRRLGEYGPKWIKYGDTSNLFTCGNGRIGVLVEDAPSACAVGVLPAYTGLSLLGTTLTSQHKMDIRKYDSIIVCLDPDAASKGIELSGKINGIRPAKTKFIPDDLKYFSSSQISEILNT